MPRFSKESQEYYKERIRGVVIIRPNAGPREICEFLKKSTPPLEISEDYVAKMRKKIMGERAYRVRIANTSLRIAEIQDKHRLIDQLLWEEALDKSNPAMVRIMALGRLSKNEQDLLQLELNTGFIEMTCEKERPKREPRLTEEEKTKIIQVFQKWNIVRPSTPEEQKVLDQGKTPEHWKNGSQRSENLEDLTV